MQKTLSTLAHMALVESMTEARRAARKTQTDVARSIGCQQSLVARIESGQRRIDVVDIVRWAKAVGVDPHIFLNVVEQSFLDSD